MNHIEIANQLSQNLNTFKGLLGSLTEKEYSWKSSPEKWCLLEIVCHLYDEEREDFRLRTKLVLESPHNPLPPIDPPAWVEERNYIGQNYTTMLQQFFEERNQSVLWLQSLENPKWDNSFTHKVFGPMTAKMFLANWLAHDYLHIRQILKLKFEYLQQQTNESLIYAGKW